MQLPPLPPLSHVRVAHTPSSSSPLESVSILGSSSSAIKLPRELGTTDKIQQPARNAESEREQFRISRGSNAHVVLEQLVAAGRRRVTRAGETG
ncbi:hypothetical protein EDC01DRAFT_783057 [Geopyxis carbonaria]|nr:hypothetical protein EDC01DRAFT_783057 [Geopyxis carbonaria]